LIELHSRKVELSDNKKPTRYYSKKQENNVAKATGGATVKNSGATMWQKGDVDVKDVSMLIECKTCVEPKKSFSIKKEWITKNRDECHFMGKDYSVISFNFGEKENFYILEEKDFKLFLEFLRNQEEE
jgi:hypothetical protein